MGEEPRPRAAKKSPLASLDSHLLSHFRPLPGRLFLAAYSGGADSTALVHMLSRLRERRGFSLLALWVDHGIRGQEERRSEQALVEANCRAWGVELMICSLDPELKLRLKHLGTEAMAREGRLAALESAAKDRNAAGILTAHTLDDQSETLLIRMLKGNSYWGLGGIPRVRGLFHRPLLDVPKARLLDYLKRHGLTWSEDSSNAQGLYERNRFRHEIVPALDRLYPRWKESLGRWSDRQREVLRGMKDPVIPYLPAKREGVQVPGDIWCSWSRDSKLFWLGSLLQTERGQRVPRGKLEQSLAELEARSVLYLPSGGLLDFRSPAASLRFFPAQGSNGGVPVAKTRDIGYFKVIPFDTPLAFSGKLLVLRRESPGIPLPMPSPGKELFLVSRSWAEGFDFPQGQKGLKKLFQTWGVPSGLRGGIPLVVDRNRVLAVLGSLLGYKDWKISCNQGIPSAYLDVR